MIENIDSIVLLERMRGGVSRCNFDPRTKSSQVVYMNRGWAEITGYSNEQLTQEKNGNPQALIFPEDKAQADAGYAAQIKCGGEYELLYRILRRDGQIRWVVDKGSVTALPDGTLQNQSTITEVTKIKEHEERFMLLAQQDQLTELLGKATFTAQVQTVLSRQSDKLHALLMLDIDGFKEVNDRFGHAAGDKVLEAVATQLKEQFRSRDVLGRVGGDEFMVFMPYIPNPQIAVQKAEELCRTISQMEKPKVPSVTVSLGVAFSTAGKDFETLFDEADTALYRAKNKGKNQVQTEETEKNDRREGVFT
ncbi:MAG: sensor domain-containing diguanylate cyclase [Eubacterium sp.]